VAFPSQLACVITTEKTLDETFAKLTRALKESAYIYNKIVDSYGTREVQIVLDGEQKELVVHYWVNDQRFLVGRYKL